MAVRIELVTPGPDFAISEQVEMPAVTVKLKGPELLAGGAGGQPPTIAPQIICDWTVKLALNCWEVPHGPRRTIAHPDIAVRTTKPELTIPFSKIRGGKLSIKVTARVGTQNLTAELDAVNDKPLRVVGTNPSKGLLRFAIPVKALRLVVQTESGCRQFEKGMPLFSQDNLGGAGLLQITTPQPTDDEIWDWRANVRAAIALFKQKLAAARACPRQVRASTNFKVLADKYNGERLKVGKKSLNLKLPDFSDDQLELDAIRGYNGYGGTDYFLGPRHLHEYRVRLDNTVPTDPELVVTEEADGVTGTLEWERTPEDLRPSGRGSYVNNVVSKGDF